MLRWVIFSVVVVVLAGIATIASTFLSTSSTPNEPVLTGQDKPSGPTGTASVTEPLTFVFGTMSQQTEGKHDWIITNTGLGDIRLQKGDSTCSCTMANLQNGQEEILPPGKTSKITLSWNTKGNDGKWSQRASILVKNDPEKQKLDFVIEGVVRKPIITFPTDGSVDFGSVENDTSHNREVAIFSIDRPETKFTIKQVSNPAVLDVNVKPATLDELKNIQASLKMMQSGGKPHPERDPAGKALGHDHGDEQVKSASKITIALKSAAPIGAFQEEILVETDHPSKPKLSLNVLGKVKGPITLTPERIRVLDVSSKKGDTQSLTIWVRGQKTTNFKVEQKPKNLEVTITPLADTSNAGAVKYQLTVKIPAGIAPGSITEEIVLKTDHPNATEVKIPVVVLVRGN